MATGIDWDGFRFFLALSRQGSLKLAAKDLKVDQATVGRRISALEGELGAKLFEKRSDGYFLTAAGSRVLTLAENAEEAMYSIERAISGKDERIEGVVRIASPGALANHFLVPRLKTLIEQYPKLEVQFLTGPEVVNLARREADIAVRLVRPSQADLLTRKIGTLELALYASERLVPRGTKLERLGEIPFIGLFERATSALERETIAKLPFTPRYQMRSAAWSSVFSAVRAGLGIGILPTFMGESDESLRLLHKEKGASAPLWLVVHPEVSKGARVRTVVRALEEAFKNA